MSCLLAVSKLFEQLCRIRPGAAEENSLDRPLRPCPHDASSEGRIVCCAHRRRRQRFPSRRRVKLVFHSFREKTEMRQRGVNRRRGFATVALRLVVIASYGMLTF